MAELFRIVSQIATPLALAGVTVMVFCVIVLAILRLPIFKPLREKYTYRIIRTILWLGFILALVAIVMSIIAFTWKSGANHAYYSDYYYRRLVSNIPLTFKT
jgi:uncharacterized PurR-regulated membrane protein YhhQ (DUF165 family)